MTAAQAPAPWPGSLDWGGDWLADAAGELEHLGFVLRDGSHPGSAPGPRLLVAFRDHPTLEHFDPEEATFWEPHAGRGRLATLDAATPLPLNQRFSWGRIQITDRVPVSNQFLSFGGTLLGAARDEHEVIVVFASRAPIVRWAGHSQGLDPFMDEIGSFFARLMVPIDFQEGAEARIAAAEPEALYAAFVHHAVARLHPVGLLRETFPDLARFVDQESHRLAAGAPASWRDGRTLLDGLQLG